MDKLPTVDEKAVKGDALSHQATYITRKYTLAASTLTHSRLSFGEPTEEVEYYDADYANNGQPFATFHFYYRSLCKSQSPLPDA
jgi:hypothetical protein